MVFRNIAKRIFGDPNERDIKRFRDIVDEINAFEDKVKVLDDAALKAKTVEFKERLETDEDLDDILTEAYAVVREVSRRTTTLRHFDVQLIGGIVLHQGKIAEMKTGEGKTLVASLPLYLNALTGRGVHLVTPNDYLSKFGLQSMGPIYHALGLTAAVIQSAAVDPSKGSFIYDPTYPSNDERYLYLRPVSRREAYAADITYGTNNEFGFDYLRDNMVHSREEMVQRGHYFAIVDEVDNILIDEARTPLIISGMADKPSDLYPVFSRLVKGLKPSSAESIEGKDPDGEYVEDLKNRSVYLTEEGIEKIEAGLRRANIIPADTGLYSPENSDMIPYLDNSLRASVVYARDKDYMVEKGQVVIVDEFTGRAMYGRRFSEGLHQAIEAKEGVTIQRENMTLATVTFQNYFRMYEKLAGMTGTAMTEADEFDQIYKLDVVAIPTHRGISREDYDDLVYMTQNAKWDAIVDEIKQRHEAHQPVLVGTVAIETSEKLASLLEKAKIPHTVLNAKQHEREAVIIAQAGRPGSVTIATNMAGRGVDILLGGNADGLAREKLRQQGLDVTGAPPEVWEQSITEAKAEVERDREIVKNAGGLFVLGTERHDARRIDNQLRGRSGRQGDPGASQFFLSLEDELMKRFGGDRVKGLMRTLNMPENEAIQAKMITGSIQQAQVRVEGYNFDIRKRVLEYDDVVNKQREKIYEQRQQVLDADNLREQIERMTAEQLNDLVDTHLPGNDRDDWDLEELYRAALVVYPVPEHIKPENWEEVDGQIVDREDIALELTKGAIEVYDKQEAKYTPQLMRFVEREVMLKAIDQFWIRHLTDLDILREGVGLVAVGQRDPLVEYKRESFKMWEGMQDEIQQQVVRVIYRVEVQVQPNPGQMQGQVQSGAVGNGTSGNGSDDMNGSNGSSNGNGNGNGTPTPQFQPAPRPGGMRRATLGGLNVKNIKTGTGSVSSYTDTPTPNVAAETPAEPIKADVWAKVGRNDPCPCGSGKKYKNCHYRVIQEQRGTATR